MNPEARRNRAQIDMRPGSCYCKIMAEAKTIYDTFDVLATPCKHPNQTLISNQCQRKPDAYSHREHQYDIAVYMMSEIDFELAHMPNPSSKAMKIPAAKVTFD